MPPPSLPSHPLHSRWHFIDLLRSRLARLRPLLLRHIPSQCAICHSWPSPALCEACVTQFAQPRLRCATCALPMLGNLTPNLIPNFTPNPTSNPASTQPRCGACLTNPPPLDAALAAVPYDYPWADLVTRFKFHDETAWAHSLALLLRSTPWVEPALEQADCLIPMPLSVQRLRERGYNQALLLAQALAASKVRPNVLLRIHDTTPQSGLPRPQRLRNMRHALAIDPLQSASIRNQRIVLVDDVMTTGASLHAAAKALRQAGASHITALVFARTE